MMRIINTRLAITLENVLFKRCYHGSARIFTSFGWNENRYDASTFFFSTLHPRNTGRPKHPMNAFLLYLQDLRQSSAHGDPRQFVKEASQRWRELPEVDKKPYLDRQKELQEVYRSELQSFNAIHSKEEKQAFLEDFRQNKQRRQKRLHRKEVLQTDPPKRNRSALAFYVSMRFSAVKVDSISDGSELLKDIMNSWKEMFSHQKQPFYDRASEDKDRYHREMDEYVQKMKADGKVGLLPVKYQKQIAAEERKTRKR